MRLNDRTVTNTNPALPPGKNEAIIFDEDMPGFGLRLRKAGARTWVYQYWMGERSRWFGTQYGTTWFAVGYHREQKEVRRYLYTDDKGCFEVRQVALTGHI